MTAETLGLVCAGGGVGATCRYGAGVLAAKRFRGPFPAGTFLINVSGCFALGLLATLLAAAHRDTAPLSALLATGFLGGYTTFSTYALETMVLLEDRDRADAITSLLGSIAVGALAAAIGAALGQVLR